VKFVKMGYRIIGAIRPITRTTFWEMVVDEMRLHPPPW